MQNIPQDYDFISISCEDIHSVALNRDGTIHCWGGDRFNRLTNVPQDNIFVSIACGVNHSIALDKDGTIYCWGSYKFNWLNIL